MRNCSLVNVKPESILLALFKEELNVINSDLRDMTSIAPINYTIVGNEIIIEPTGNFAYKSWALYTNRNDSKITVEDEDGEVVIQDVHVISFTTTVERGNIEVWVDGRRFEVYKYARSQVESLGRGYEMYKGD